MPREDVIIQFGGDIRDVKKSLNEIEGAVVGFRNTLSGFGPLLGFLGIAGAGDALAQFIEDMDALGATAAGLNTTTEALYELGFAVGQTSKITDQELVTVLQKLSKHIGKANAGSKESQAIFRDLGLNWQALAELRSDEAFLAVAEAINTLPNAYERAAVAQRLFEDPWRKLLPSLMVGAEGLRDLMGQVSGPSAELVQSAAELNSAIDLLNRRFDELTFTVGPGVLSLLSRLVSLATIAAQTFTQWRNTFDEALERARQQSAAFGPLLQFIEGMINPMARLENLLPGLQEAFGGAPTLPETPGAPIPVVPPELFSVPAMAPQAQARATKAAKEAAISDTRRQAQEEARIWQNYHAEISALQEGNAMAAKAAQEAQVRALNELIRAGASRTREEFYRQLVGEETGLPAPKMRVVLDEESLFALPEQLQRSLSSADYNVTIQARVAPTLIVDDATTRAVDQAGGVP